LLAASSQERKARGVHVALELKQRAANPDVGRGKDRARWA
jgi:hypothetical protein